MERVKIKDLSFANQARKLEMHTGISEDDRAQVVSQLNGVLADHYLLMLKTHNYHWNVKGPLFKSLHDLTEEQYEDFFAAIDVIAERIRALGFDAPGTFTEYQALSQVQEARKGISDMEMAADLTSSHENVIRNMRETLKTAESVGDEVTVDLMVERLSAHEKYAWMLRSFIER